MSIAYRYMKLLVGARSASGIPRATNDRSPDRRRSSVTHTLSRVAHEHHERLLERVDEMPAVGDLILAAPEAELRPRLEGLGEFLTGTLLPHMDVAEPTIYPEMERLLQNRHSMTPMRREHAEIRGLVAEYVRLMDTTRDAKHSLGKAVALRRVVFQLYALLKVHVAEEEMYIRIIDHDAAPDAAEVMVTAIEGHTIGGSRPVLRKADTA
jgi:hypothetical protein